MAKKENLKEEMKEDLEHKEKKTQSELEQDTSKEDGIIYKEENVDLSTENVDVLTKEELEQAKDDKETKLEPNDEVIEKGYLKALLKQKEDFQENRIYYEVNNIYSNEEKRTYKSRLKLRADPPKLTIKDEEGGEVEFLLTEKFTDELIDTLGEVKRAYHGFDSPVDINAPQKPLDKVKYYISKNAFKVTLLLFIIIYFVVITFN